MTASLVILAFTRRLVLGKRGLGSISQKKQHWVINLIQMTLIFSLSEAINFMDLRSCLLTTRSRIKVASNVYASIQEHWLMQYRF